MITYKKINEITTKHGIEIPVDFFDDLAYVHTRTFVFSDQSEIESEFTSRMEKAISNIQDDIDELGIKTEVDVILDIEKYFETNTEITKEDYENLKAGISIEVEK